MLCYAAGQTTRCDDVPARSDLVSTTLVVLLVGQDDEQTAEYSDEINEQVERVTNEIVIAHSALLNDHLSVVKYKATHHQQSEVDVNRE